MLKAVLKAVLKAMLHNHLREFNKTIMAHVPSRPKKDTVVRNHPFEITICVHDCMTEEPRLKQMNSMYSLFV